MAELPGLGFVGSDGVLETCLLSLVAGHPGLINLWLSSIDLQLSPVAELS